MRKRRQVGQIGSKSNPWPWIGIGAAVLILVAVIAAQGGSKDGLTDEQRRLAQERATTVALLLENKHGRPLTDEELKRVYAEAVRTVREGR